MYLHGTAALEKLHDVMIELKYISVYIPNCHWDFLYCLPVTSLGAVHPSPYELALPSSLRGSSQTRTHKGRDHFTHHVQS